MFRLEKSWNGDTLGPVELILKPEQGDRRKQDYNGEVSIIIFGMIWSTLS